MTKEQASGKEIWARLRPFQVMTMKGLFLRPFLSCRPRDQIMQAPSCRDKDSDKSNHYYSETNNVIVRLVRSFHLSVLQFIHLSILPTVCPFDNSAKKRCIPTDQRMNRPSHITASVDCRQKIHSIETKCRNSRQARILTNSYGYLFFQNHHLSFSTFKNQL